MTDYNFKPKQGKDDYGWYDRGYIPHFDGGPVPQFVTFRLADSLPQTVLEKLRKEAENDSTFRKSVEHYLDSGVGQCHLRIPAIAQMVVDALKFHEGVKYDLFSWVIMPNHGHVLLRPLPNVHLGDVLHSIKSFTAQKANEMLGRKGPFWQAESFDRYIRNQDHFISVIRYIENNPVAAGLCRVPLDWEFSSARERQAGRMPALQSKTNES